MSDYIIGSDECGYGSWAGPLFVCAYVAPAGWTVPGLNDSKKLSPNRRKAVYRELPLENAIVLSVSSEDIDRFGAFKALISAHTQAIHCLQSRGYLSARVVVDGSLRLPDVPNAESIPKADSLIPAVMAASVVAKVNRDFLMQEMHLRYPEYGFNEHVGYGAPRHMEALSVHGPCPIHRRSYRPIKELLNGSQRMVDPVPKGGPPVPHDAPSPAGDGAV